MKMAGRKSCPPDKWRVNGHCVPKNTFCNVAPISLNHVGLIKEHKDDDAILVKKQQREGLIFPQKYGDKWWKRAEREDIERVTVW